MRPSKGRTRSFAGCALAASGHPAAPPMRATNSRRLHVGKARKVALERARIKKSDDTARGIARVGNKIGMRDDAALAIENVADAALADFQCPHKVPDKLEIDLDNAHASVSPRAGERERHIRLGFAAQIDRAVVDPVRHRLSEFGVLRVIDLLADHVRAKPRDAQLLLSGGIELGKLGDGRHPTQ